MHAIYRPVLTYFRRKRLRHFYEMNNVGPQSRILDVGGTAFFWNLASSLGLPAPGQIVILNNHEATGSLPANINWICADARRMPLADRAFDIVFSNSVIEHLGDAKSQQMMASEIRRVGCGYWVQTPDPRFPIEPHYLTPFIHWLPRDRRRRFIRNGTIWGLITRPDDDAIDERLVEIKLINAVEFRSLFPDARIIVERFCGLPKALIASRQAARPCGALE